MAQVLTIKNLYEKKFSTLPIGGKWADALGEPESHGCWLIWGKDKNGKTQTALQLTDMLSESRSVLYVSAEEGTGKAFVENCQRAGISTKNKRLRFLEYTPVDELNTRLGTRRSEDIVVVDNLTIYNDELKNGVLRQLLNLHGKKKLFIFLAHEDRNEPYTSTAKLVRKLAKVIFYTEGLQCLVSGRVPGGVVNIDDNKARLYHGEQTIKN